jgi:glutamate/tyrosine decarboxylase-like PLP-dependent enzyme
MPTHTELLKRAATIANRFLDGLDDRSLKPSGTIDTLRSSFDVPLSDAGEAEIDVLEGIAAGAEGGLSGSAGPRYFGFVIGGSLPVALATDWLVSTWDQNAGIYVTSPASSVVEEVAARWLLEVLALPRTASVGFVTGCQMADFTALAAARHSVLRRVGWNVEELGLTGAPRVNIVVGAEAHITIHSSLRMLGFGTKTLIQTATDDQGRMIAGEVAKALRGLEGPAIICCQAGNVNTGAFDPVGELAAIAHERGAWLHVDAAFGLWAAASPRRRSLVQGVELADSWATDAHKWLNVPYDSGIAIVADSAAHRASMTLSAAYLEQTARRAICAASQCRPARPDLVGSRTEPGARAVRGRGAGFRRADAERDPSRAAGGDVLARWHHVARHGRDADLGLELVDDGSGCRCIGRGNPSMPRSESAE